MKLTKLNFPEYEFSFKSVNKQKYIFDRFRKKHVTLTPEEWVRQNLANYLILQKNHIRFRNRNNNNNKPNNTKKANNVKKVNNTKKNNFKNVKKNVKK